MWLLALYQVASPRSRAPTSRGRWPAPRRTTSSRSTSRAGPTCSRPAPSLRLITDMIAYTVANVPKWNPINICSYHLQEAGATPVQEVAYALSTAIAVLDAVRDSGQVPGATSRRSSGASRSSSTPGVRFIEEIAKLRRSPGSGTSSAGSATGSPTRRCVASVTPRRDRAGGGARPFRRGDGGRPGAALDQRGGARRGDAGSGAAHRRRRARRAGAAGDVVQRHARRARRNDAGARRLGPGAAPAGGRRVA